MIRKSKMAVRKGFFDLLELQKRLKYFAYTKLDLKHLQPLIDEVDVEIERAGLRNPKGKKMMKKVPIQPIMLDDKGVLRFQENRIVSILLAFSEDRMDMNKISKKVQEGVYTIEEYEQFMMLIGYSLGGFGELHLVRNKTFNRHTRRLRKPEN